MQRTKHKSLCMHAAELVANGYTLVADTLARLGVRLMFGVVGIPVTELASAAQVPNRLDVFTQYFVRCHKPHSRD